MSCRWCEKDVAPSAKFCPHCGAENPYEDKSKSIFNLIPYLISTPLTSFDALGRLIFCSYILYLSSEFFRDAIGGEGIDFTPIGIFLSLFMISLTLLCIYVLLKVINYFFPYNTPENTNELLYKSIFSIQFIKFVYSKKFITSVIKKFKCVSWTQAERNKKTMKEFKLKSLEEAEILESKLGYAVCAFFTIPFILFVICIKLFK